LVGTSYDLAGNVIQSGTATYGYDAENQITTLGASAAYVYDGDGNRVKKLSGTLDWGPGPLTESDLSGNVTAEYVFFNGKRVARIDPPASVRYYFSDHLGSSSVVTDALGVIKDESDYYPYGGEIPVVNNDPNHFKFTGKERDSESGNDYFGARYYASTMGRWLSPDKPFADQHLIDPQSWNLYEYGRNNPLIHVDPTGHACTSLNSGSGFCQRADLYANYDALVRSKTRFFAAASAVTQAIANVDSSAMGIRFGALGASQSTRNLLENIGQSLQKLNTETVGKILSGAINMSGPELDHALVHKEQTQVQSQLDSFKANNPDAFGPAMKEINALLNPDQRSAVQTDLGAADKSFEPTDAAMDALLGQVQKSLGHDIDFANQADREAIGNALADNVRKTGGCGVGGSRVAGCN